MIAADIARAVLLATIPLAAALGVLRIEFLVAVAFLVETFTVFFDIAYLTYIPSLISGTDSSRPTAAGSDRVRRAVIGPALGEPWCAHWRALALVVDALSYLVSAALIWRIRAHEAPAGAHRPRMSLRAEIGQGLHAVWQSPALRALALSSTVMNVAGFLFLSIYVLYMTRDLGLGAEAVGLVFAAGGVGALLGSVSAGPARGRWGVGRVLLGSQMLFGLFGMLVPPVRFRMWHYRWSWPRSFCNGSWCSSSVNAVGLRQAITPRSLAGPGDGTMRFIVWGSRPIGSLLGGYLGSRIGLPVTLVVGAFGMLIAFVPLLTSPIPRLRHLDVQ